MVEVSFMRRLFCSGFSHQGIHSKDFILALIEIDIVSDHVTDFYRVFDFERCISGGMMASEDRALFDTRHLVDDMLVGIGFGTVPPPGGWGWGGLSGKEFPTFFETSVPANSKNDFF